MENVDLGSGLHSDEGAGCSAAVRRVARHFGLVLDEALFTE